MKLPGFLRPPPMFSHEKALQRLASFGFAPKIIYDVGAFHGYWTKAAKKVFPRAQYMLFEANPDNAVKLAETGERHLIAALAAADKASRTFYLPKSAVGTGASLYREQTEHYAGDNLRAVSVTTRRLDALVADERLPMPDLIKLDVQGAELDVLAGAGDVLTHTSALIAELSLLTHNEGAPLFAQVVEGIDRLGFKCADVCDVLRADNGGVMQIDLLFVKPALFEKFRSAAGLR